MIMMKKFFLFSMIALTLFAGSCVKNTVTPLSYLIDTVSNAYINNNDSLYLPLNVKFVAGNESETVTLTITGLPHNVTMAKDTLRGQNNFVAGFKLYANGAIIGNYPVVLVAYSPTTGYKYYSFNLGVVHSNCSSYLTGSFSGVSACKISNYTFPITVTAVGDTGINVVNMGGYGTNTLTYAQLNCNTDSVYISRQYIGNGVTMWGQGHFTANQIVISYIALNIPGGGNDTCTAIMNR